MVLPEVDVLQHKLQIHVQPVVSAEERLRFRRAVDRRLRVREAVVGLLEVRFEAQEQRGADDLDGIEEACGRLQGVSCDAAAGVEAAWFRFHRLEDDLQEVVGEAEAKDVREVGGGVGKNVAVGFLFGKGFWRSIC